MMGAKTASDTYHHLLGLQAISKPPWIAAGAGKNRLLHSNLRISAPEMNYGVDKTSNASIVEKAHGQL